MNQSLLDFLTSNNISVLSIVLPDGTSHSASMHFSFSENPFRLYFSTKSSSRKCQGLLNREKGSASLVIGFSEEEWITLQIDGEIKVIKNFDEIATVKTIHYAKNPGSKRFENDPETVFLEFIPDWWRYTDFNTKPMTIITSELNNK